MHSCNFDISLKNLTKIEGHAQLYIKIRNKKVDKVELRVTENKRFFKQAIFDKPFQSVPNMVSRICGTCSIAHNLCAIEAIEKALNIIPTKQTILLRKLAMYTLILRDHALHLYFFVLPDVYKKDSILDFEDDLHYLLHDVFDIKSVSNNLANIIVGRPIHGYNADVGGFNKIPSQKDLNNLIPSFYSIRKKIINLVDIFFNCDFIFDVYDKNVALYTEDFSFLEGYIYTSDNDVILEKDFYKHLHTRVIPYSQSVDKFVFDDDRYIVGALSRLNLNKECLHKNTKKDLKKYLSIFPSKNIYHNNLAQAIEMLHCVDSIIDIIEKNKFVLEDKIQIKNKEGSGVGLIEAPRGILYYHLDIKDNGRVIDSNIVIPTAQNVISMQYNIKRLVEQNINMDKKYIEHEIEKLIRAYDPCMSCATHFLKVKWI